MYNALQGGTNAEDADAFEVEEEAAYGSDEEEEVGSEGGASEFEDKEDKAKRRTGKTSNSMCISHFVVTVLNQKNGLF